MLNGEIMVSLEEKLSDLYPNQDSNKIYTSGREGYWSNLSKEENDAFSSALASSGTKAAVRSVIPQFEEMIFSEKREAALELLDHRKPGVCIDYGCMWGVLSVGMAKRGHQVVSIDKTYHSLNFLRYRVDEDKLNNVHIIQDDIKEVEISNLADYAIVNGVLEWIPILEEVDVNNYYSGGQSANTSTHSPKQMQREFLSKVNHSLKDGGKMLLAIENRHFYQYYMGRKDPHANLLFTTFLPRWLSNVVSRLYHSAILGVSSNFHASNQCLRSR